MKSGQGFTILELSIVLMIIGLLAVFAYPTYVESIQRGNRNDVQAAMTQIAQRLETWKNTNHGYGGLTASMLTNANIYGSTSFPASGTALYTLALVPQDGNGDGGMDGWVLTATPIAGKRQDKNGIVVLNDQGQRCWDKGSASACTPSATTIWATK